MKIGILGCGFNCIEDIETRLNPWFEISKENNIIFSFTSCEFSEYSNINTNKDNSKTIEYFQKLKNENKIKYLFCSDQAMSESEARNKALYPLLNEKIDILWLLDLSDEYYNQSEIQKIIKYIENNNLEQWFSINFKNYIFDGKQWIDDFCPPRIFRNSEKISINSFYWDNDILFNFQNQKIQYINFSNKKIPKAVAHVKHMTWLHSNGQAKVEYQMKHFGHCSYKWNQEHKKLEINKEFYIKNRIPFPIINHD
jgi:hypothetical protein